MAAIGPFLQHRRDRDADRFASIQLDDLEAPFAGIYVFIDLRAKDVLDAVGVTTPIVAYGSSLSVP